MIERDAFQAHLREMGYELDQSNPLFEWLRRLYSTSGLYDVVPTEFFPIFVWNKRAKAALAPYKVMGD